MKCRNCGKKSLIDFCLMCQCHMIQVFERQMTGRWVNIFMRNGRITKVVLPKLRLEENGRS